MIQDLSSWAVGVWQKKMVGKRCSIFLYISKCYQLRNRLSMCWAVAKKSTFGFPPCVDAVRMGCVDKSLRLQVNFRHAYNDSDLCWQTETADKTSVLPRADLSTRTGRQIVREIGRQEFRSALPVLSRRSKARSHYLSLNGVCLPAAQLSPHPVTPLYWDPSLSEPMLGDICQHV